MWYLRWITTLFVCLLLIGCDSWRGQPSKKHLRTSLAQTIPSYYEIIGFTIEATEDIGDTVDPKFKSRFTAVVRLQHNVYVESHRDPVASFIQLIGEKGHKQKLYGRATSQLRLEQWQTNIELENRRSLVKGTLKENFPRRVVILGTQEIVDYETELLNRLTDGEFVGVAAYRTNTPFFLQERSDVVLRLKHIDARSRWLEGEVLWYWDGAYVKKRVEGSFSSGQRGYGDMTIQLEETDVIDAKGATIPAGLQYRLNAAFTQNAVRFSSRWIIPQSGRFTTPNGTFQLNLRQQTTPLVEDRITAEIEARKKREERIAESKKPTREVATSSCISHSTGLPSENNKIVVTDVNLSYECGSEKGMIWFGEIKSVSAENCLTRLSQVVPCIVLSQTNASDPFSLKFETLKQRTELYNPLAESLRRWQVDYFDIYTR